MILLYVFHINQDGVVLAGPLALALAAIVIGPDDFVEKVVSSEKPIQHDLGIVSFSVVKVQINGAGCFQDSLCLLEPRVKKVPVISEGVVVGHDAGNQLAVLVSTEASGSIFRALRLSSLSLLDTASVEGRVNIDKVHRFTCQRLQNC